MSFGDLFDASNRLANGLRRHGVCARRPGRDPAAAGARGRRPRHIAIYKLGAIAVPLAVLFGVDALALPAQRFRR